MCVHMCMPTIGGGAERQRKWESENSKQVHAVLAEPHVQLDLMN